MADNTFLGLQSYNEDDAYRFKGRTVESQDLFRLIVRNDFTVCYAESGEGKTSLLNAGVFPLLRENMYYPIAITFTSDDYQVTPDDFGTIIDRCIKNSIAEYNEKNTGINVEYRLCSSDFQGIDFQAELQQELSKYSWWKLRNYKPQTMGLTFTPVFVFDQFEEVFNMPGSIVWTKKFFDWLEDVSSNSCPDEIATRVRAIIGTNTAFPTIKEEKNFKAVFSLRKEFIGELDYWAMQKCFIPALKDNRYCLKPLTYEGAMKVMTQNGLFDKYKVMQVLMHFVRQYSREPEKTIKENLPVIPALLLSVVCDSLEKDIDAVTSLNTEEISQSLGKILEQFYNQAIDSVITKFITQNNTVSPEQCRYDIDTIVSSLIDDNGKRVRTKTTTRELIQIDFDNKYKKILSDYRIIKISKIENEDYVEIIHDILCPIVYRRKEYRQQLAKEIAAKRIEEENRQIKIQNDRLNKIRSLFLSEKSISCSKNRYLAQKLALEALPTDIDNPDKPLVPQAESALRMSIRFPHCPMIGHNGMVTQVLGTFDSTKILSSSYDGVICIWDSFSGGKLKELDWTNYSVFKLSIINDKLPIGVVYSKGVILIYSLNDSTVLDRFPFDASRPSAIAISPDGTRIAIGLEGGCIMLYLKGQETRNTYSSIKKIEDLTFSPNGKELIVLGEGGLNCFSIEKEDWNSLNEECISAISCICYSRDSRYLLCGTENGKIVIWDSNNGRRKINTIDCEYADSKINAISISGDTKHIAYSVGGKLVIYESTSLFDLSTQDLGVKAIDVQPLKEYILDDEFAPVVTSIAWSHDDRYVIWGDVEGLVSMYDMKTEPQQRVLLKATSFMKALEYSPDGQKIFCLSYHNTIRIIDSIRGKVLYREFHANKNTIGKEVQTNDGNYKAVYNTNQHKLELFEKNHQKAKHTFAFDGELTSLAFSSDSSVLALSTKCGDVICWNTENGKFKYRLIGSKSIYNTVLFNPNGGTVATTGPNRDVLIWNVESGEPHYTIPADKGYVLSLAYSPDGDRLAIGMETGEIRIWNTSTKEQVDTFEINKSGVSVRCLCFSPDGEMLTASYSDGLVILWTCPRLKTLISDVRQKLFSRKFTEDEKKKYYLEDNDD